MSLLGAHDNMLAACASPRPAVGVCGYWGAPATVGHAVSCCCLWHTTTWCRCELHPGCTLWLGVLGQTRTCRAGLCDTQGCGYCHRCICCIAALLQHPQACLCCQRLGAGHHAANAIYWRAPGEWEQLG